MTESERFRAVFLGGGPDRLPVYFFGSWGETKRRWRREGLVTDRLTGDAGPQIEGMDPDWEEGLWDCHGLAHSDPIGDGERILLEETEEYLTYRDALGEVCRYSRRGESIPQILEYSLLPTRESWERFKGFLNPDDPRRRPEGWRERAAELNGSGKALVFMGGSLYGWLRNRMGVEAISCLMYDDPLLFDEMVGYMGEYFMRLFEPIVKKVRFDAAYFFEDCCGSAGPLFSPEMYARFFDRRYRDMVRFYKENGVALTMLDSDGKVEKLIPCWLGSGIDILFPVEVGVWGASPVKLRETFGAGLKMFGGVDKHVIPKGEAAIREHLNSRKPAVLQGGYLPIPDHRIPPDCSYEQFLTYVKVFREVFGS